MRISLTRHSIWSLTHVLRALRGIVVMLHPMPVLCTLVATALFALFARYPPHAPTLLRLIGAMAALQMAIGALNDYVDLPLDRQTKPWKPLVRGDLQPRTALWLTIVGLLAGLFVVAALGTLAVVLAMVGAGAGIVYNLYLKTTVWSWFPYLVGLPLLPVWVWIAIRGWDIRLLLLYPLGALMVIGLHLADTLPDIDADKEHGVQGFAHRLGARRALRLCWLSLLLPPLLTIIAALASLADMRYIAPAALLSLLLTGHAIAYYVFSRRRDWRLHFTLLAAAVITLAGGWLLSLR